MEPGKDGNLIRAIYAIGLFLSLLIPTSLLRAQHSIPGVYHDPETGTVNPIVTRHTGVNTAPLNEVSPKFISEPILFIKGGEDYTYHIEVSDGDGDMVLVSATSLPDWLNLSVNYGYTSSFAGSGTKAQVDGQGSTASFSTPYGLTVADNGNVYVADAGGTALRLITPDGQVSSLALTNESGDPFSLASIHDVAIDSQGNLYVPERFKHRILKIDTDLKVTVLAGGSQGFINGNGTVARFKFPMGLAVDSDDNIYVSDSGNSAIRKIDANGDVTTFAGGKGHGSNDGDYTTAKLADPFEIAIDKDDNIYVADRGTGRIRKITPERQVTTLAGSGTQPDGSTTYPLFDSPTGIDVDDAGNVYVADLGNDVVRRISVSGEVTVIAGVLDQAGDVTGDAEATRFDGPAGVAVGPSGKLYVVDHRNHKVKQIGGTYYLSGKAGTEDGDYDIVLTATDETGESTEQSFKLKVEGVHAPEIISTPVLTVDEKTSYHYPIYTKDDNGDPVTVTAVTKPDWLTLKGSSANQVSLWAGNGVEEHKDGTGAQAAFQSPYGLMAEPDGTLYVADGGGNSIRVISPEGVVSTMKLTNGQGDDFALKSLFDVVRDSQGNFYLPERTNHRVVKVSPEGVVSILAGSTRGFRDGAGTTAKFNYPMGLAVDSDDNIYVADSNNNRIRKISPTGHVSTIGQSTDFADPFEIASGPDGNLYVADRGGNRVIKLSLQGEATVIAGSGTQSDGTGTYPRLGRPTGIDVDASGNVYIAEIENHTIRKISPSGVVSLLAGAIKQKGDAQGEASVARFNGPAGITVDAAGNLYVAEVHSDVIRKISVGSYWLEGTANVLPGAYNVSLKAEDPGGAMDTQDFVIQVLDKTAPTLTSARRVEFPENSSEVTYTVTADDASPLSFVLGSDRDEHLFQLNETTGELRFITPPDFETPLSKSGSNVYNVFITISDSNGNLIGVTITIEVTDASDYPPVFTSTPVESVNQNEDYQYVITTIEPDHQEVTITAVTKPDWLTLKSSSANQVSLWAGNGVEEHKDGTGDQAAFQSPYGLMAEPDGTLYVADGGGNSIRVISPEGVVSTMKLTNGQGDDFALKSLFDVVRDSQGNFYLPERTNHRVVKVSPEGVVSILAGSTRGFRDGAGTTAKFNYPMGLAVDSDDNIYVADSNNNRIRKISPTGHVSTIGQSTDFADPFEIASGPDGNLYVADRGGNRVIKLTLQGEATVIAGSGTQPDGTGTYPRLGRPTGIDVDASGNVYIAEIENHTIRKISPSGVVSILAGAIKQKGDAQGDASVARFNGPAGITVDAAGNLYVAEVHSDVIRKISGSFYWLEGTANVLPGAYNVSLKAEDPDGDMDTQDFVIQVLDKTAPVLTSAQSVEFTENSSEVAYTVTADDASPLSFVLGSDRDEHLFQLNETTGELRFITPPDFETPLSKVGNNVYSLSITITDSNGNSITVTITIEVTDVSDYPPVFTSTPVENVNQNEDYQYVVTTIEPDHQEVTLTAPGLPDWLRLRSTDEPYIQTIAGSGEKKGEDGSGANASFARPYGVKVGPDGNIYVADAEGGIRVVTPGGEVSSVQAVNSDGSPFSFRTPHDVDFDSKGNMYVPERENDRIIKVDVNGTATVFAGDGKRGFEEGAGSQARFSRPMGVGVDSQDNVYVADETNFRIRKITPEGFVSTLAGGGSGDGTGSDAGFSYPFELTIDQNDVIYVADRVPSLVRRVDIATASVTTYAGFGTQVNSEGRTVDKFNSLTGIDVDHEGNVYVADLRNRRIAKIDQTGTVTTLAGDFTPGFSNGWGTSAQLNNPAAVAVDPAGKVYVADQLNHRIRRIDQNPYVLESTKGKSADIYPIVLTATDTDGNSTDQQFNITVANSTPEITAIELDEENGFLEMRFTEPLFSAADATSFVTSDMFTLQLSGGTAQNLVVTGLTNENGLPVAGGEASLRLNFTLDGLADGTEQLDLTFTESEFYDAEGTTLSTYSGPRQFTLFDKIVPTVQSLVMAADNSYLDVTFNEPIFNHRQSDGALDRFSIRLGGNEVGHLSPFITTHYTDFNDGPLTVPASEVRVYFTLGGVPNGSEQLSIEFQTQGLKDAAGNFASISQLARADLNDQLGPQGYGLSSLITGIGVFNETNFSFDLSDAELNGTYSYTISSSGGGTSLTAQGNVTGANQSFGPIDVSSLPDGTLTVEMVLSDALGNEGTPASIGVTKDTTPPVMAFTERPEEDKIIVAFSENIAVDQLVASDFTLTDCNGTTFMVQSITDDVPNDNLLTLNITGVSGIDGSLVLTYTRGTGTIKDDFENAMVSDGTGVTVFGGFFNIKNAVFRGSKNISLNDQNLSFIAGDMGFSNDGSKLYVSGQIDADRNAVLEYRLDDPYDLTNATFSGLLEFTEMGFTGPKFDFSQDGKKLLVYKPESFDVVLYTLGVPFDLATQSNKSNLTLSGGPGRLGLKDMWFSDDGLLFTGLYSETSAISFSYNGANEIVQYRLNTAYAFNSIVLSSRKSVDLDNDTPESFEFSDDGTGLFIISASQKVLSYRLTNPFDIGTATFVANEEGGFSPSFSDPKAVGLSLADAGRSAFLISPDGQVDRYNFVDENAPSVTEVVQSSSTSITVQLSEKVTLNTNAGTNFILTDGTGTVFQVNSVSEASDNTIELSVADMSAAVGDLSLLYTNANNQVVDVACIPLAGFAEPWLIDIDQQAPVMSALTKLSDTELQLTFSESVQFGGFATSDFTLKNGLGNSVSILSMQPSQVSNNQLILEVNDLSGFVGDAVLTYSAANGVIEDFGDNTMDADNVGVIADLDTTLPTLISASVVGDKQIKLVFSETVDVNRIHEDDFSIKDGLGNPIDVNPQNVGHIPGSELTLSVVGSVTHRTGDFMVTYTNAHGAVRDFGGNVMATDLTGVIIDRDKVAPTLIAAVKENDQSLMLVFDEPVKSITGTTTGFKVTDGLGNEGTGLIQEDPTPLDNVVTLKVNNLSTLIGDPVITYENIQNEIADFGSNYLDNNLTGVVADLDVTAPAMVSAVNDNNQRLILTFSEPVQLNGADPADFTLIDSEGGTFEVTGLGDELPKDSEIELTVRDLNLVVGTLTLSYAKTTGAISDFGGNDLVTDTEGVTIADDVAPVILSAKSHRYNEIEVIMSEQVKLQANPGGRFKAKDCTGREFEVTFRGFIHSDKTRIRLGISDMWKAASYLHITYENSGTVTDLSGNLLDQDLVGKVVPRHYTFGTGSAKRRRGDEGFPVMSVLSISTATEMEFSHDGLKLFILGTAENTSDQYIYELSLSSPFDLSTSVYQQVKLQVSVNTEDITSFVLNHTGTQLFVLNGPESHISIFDLAMPYDLSDVTYRGDDERGTFPEESFIARGMDFNQDGTKLTILRDEPRDPLPSGITPAGRVSRELYFEFEPANAYNVALINDVSDGRPNSSGISPHRSAIKYDHFDNTITRVIPKRTSFFGNISQIGLTDGPQSGTDGTYFEIVPEDIDPFDVDFDALGDKIFVLGDRIYEFEITDQNGPVMEEARVVGETSLDIHFSERVAVNGLSPSDFGIMDCRGNIFQATSVIDYASGDRNIRLVVSDLNLARGGITVTYTNNLNGIVDLHCNAMESDLIGVTAPLLTDSYNVDKAVLSKRSRERSPYRFESFTGLNDIFFGDHGRQLFMNQYKGSVTQFVLDQPYDFNFRDIRKGKTFFSVEGIASVSASDFDETGNIWYALSGDNNRMSTYTLLEPHNLRTARKDITVHLLLSSEIVEATDFVFNGEGTRLFILAEGVYVYELSQPFDLSNAQYLGKDVAFDAILNPLDSESKSFAFNHNGLELFILGTEHNRIYNFKLGTPYDPTTAVYAGSDKDLEIDLYRPVSIVFNSYGNKLFVASADGNITMYELPVDLDNTAPVLESGRTENANELILSFSEEVTLFESYPEDFIVTDGIGNVLMVDAVSDITAGDNEITLSVATLSSAVGDVRVTYINNHNEVADFNCNALATDAVGVLIDTDTTAPTLVSATKDNNTQLTLTFSEPVQTNGGNPTDFTVTDLAGTSFSVIAQADGTASDNQIVLTTADLNSALSQLSITYENHHDELADFGGNLLATDVVGVKVIVDFIAPDVTISSPLSGTVNTDIPITITFTEDVVNFDLTDITVSNGVASGFSGSGAVYMASISPSADGAVLVDIGGGAAQDAAGNDNTVATQFSIQADITAPDAPLVKAVSDDTGADDTDFVTSDQTLIFSGTAEVNSLVEIFIDGSSIGTTLTDGFGEWTYDYSTVTLADASYSITTRATDVIGNVGNQGGALSVVVDTNAPTNPLLAGITEDTGISNTDFITNDPTLIYSGTAEPFATIKLGSGPFTLLTTTADASGNWVGDATARSFSNSINLFVTATDAAGNESPNSNTFLIGIDTNAPDVQSIVRADPNPTSAGSVEYIVTFSEAVYGITTANFNLVFTGTQNAAVAGLSANSGASITVTVDNITGEGSFGLNLNNTSGITDAAGNDLSGTLTGEVYNTNISPTDISLSAGSVLENNAIGDVVATLTASDPDAGDTHAFSFATGAGDTDNASFTIDGNELKAAEVFDLETKAGYSIRIQADDGRGGTYEQVFAIAIDNVPEADMRITGDLDIPATPLGISTTFDITIHNDGDATLDVTSIFYPTAFNGPVSGNGIAPGGSEVITMSFTPPAAQTYTGDITINSNGGTGVLSVSADGAIITSLEGEILDAEAIRIYPNPAIDVVTIDLTEYNGQGLDIQLYDVSGNETFAVSDYRKTELRLDVSAYRNGLYLVQFTNGGHTVQKKIMIRK